jgi:hypothetical protein
LKSRATNNALGAFSGKKWIPVFRRKCGQPKNPEHDQFPSKLNMLWISAAPRSAVFRRARGSTKESSVRGVNA